LIDPSAAPGRRVKPTRHTTNSRTVIDRLDATDTRRYPHRTPHSKRANMSQLLDAGHLNGTLIEEDADVSASAAGDPMTCVPASGQPGCARGGGAGGGGGGVSTIAPTLEAAKRRPRPAA
jgi:hypothetical protein